MDQSSLMMLDNKYILISKLGTGGTSEVRLGEHKDTHERVAVKILKNNNYLKIFAQEFAMLNVIDNKNIIKIIEGGSGSIVRNGVCTDPKYYLILELAENGELFDYVFYPRCGFGEEKGLYLFKGLLDGLEACHNSGVVHRDIKMENMMLNSKWEVKIADFGFATLIKGKTGNGILTTPLGTLSYAAPEILHKQPYLGAPADVFSLGAVLFTLVTGRMGFNKAIKADPFYRYIWGKDYTTYWTMISSNNKIILSDEFKDLIVKMLACDPKERITFSDIRSHPWMMNKAAEYEELKDDFEKRAMIVQKSHEIELQKQKMSDTKKGPFTVYRSPEDGDYFGINIKCGVYNESDSTTSRIGIKGISPYVFMNQLAEFFDKSAKGTKSLETSDDKGELIVSYEFEPIDDCEYEYQPLKIVIALKSIETCVNDHVLELHKECGDKMEFYEVFDEVLNFIQKLDQLTIT